MQQIAGWLEKLGLGQYAPRFAENDINFAVLSDLTDQDLKELGVSSLGHRRQLLRAIAELNSVEKGAPKLAPATAALVTPLPHDAAERRQLTVMFCDLVGSTALSARLDPEDMREIVGAYHRSCAEQITKAGGFVAKYMGDGVLAYFGYPQAHEHDAERAVLAGLALVEAVPMLKTVAGTPLQVRVGIATGLVVVGDLIGAGAAQEQAVVGDTPNLAARLQALAEPNMVVLADSTRRLLGNLFELKDLGPRDLKGIAGPARAWAALRASSVASRFDALHTTGLTALVGREEESELLLRRWSRAKRGEGQVVLLSGEAGIGKSRLTAALLERLSGEAHTRLRYFCSPQHTDSAFYPIIGQMERAAGLAHDDKPQAKLDKLDAVLAQTSTSTEDAALFAEMLSLPNDGRYPALHSAPEQRRQRTLEALTSQFAGLARQKPVLTIFEDAHWVDPTSLEVLGRIVDRIKTLQALLIVTSRPEFNAPWVGQSHATSLTLNRLGEREAAAIIARLAGNKALPADVLAEIVERTDGIPLFVEEMTKAVLEAESEGAARRTVAAVPFSALAVPASLHASLMARLDRLGPAKEVAQIGSAIGREFSHQLLAAVARKSEAELGSAFDRLIQAGLLSRQGVPPQASYLFKHALVQDAAYSTLLRSRRQQLHARIAAILESKFPETVAATPEILAQHYTLAGSAAQAVPCWLKAGQAALNRSTLTEAIGHLTKGLGLVQGIVDETVRAELELGLQTTLAVVLAGAKGFAVPEVEQAYVRARALCDQIGKNQQFFPVLYGLFLFHWVRAHLETARSGAEEMLSIATETGDRALQLIAHFSLGGVLWHIGNNRASLDHLAKAHALYDEKIDASLASEYGQDFGVWTLSYLANAQLSLGYPERSSRAIADALALARRLNHPLSLCNALNFSSMSSMNRREPALVLKFTEETLAIATEHGFPQYIALATMNRGWALAQLGAADEGIELGQQGIAMWHTLGASVALPGLLAGYAQSQLIGGRIRAALETTDEALTWIDKSTDRAWDSSLHSCRGGIFWAMGEPDRAQEEFQFALSVARQQENRLQELVAATLLARLWGDRGRRSEARDKLAPVYNTFTEGFDTPVLRDAKALLDHLL